MIDDKRVSRVRALLWGVEQRLRAAEEPEFCERRQIKTGVDDQRRAELAELAWRDLLAAADLLRREQLLLCDDYGAAVADRVFGEMEPKAN